MIFHAGYENLSGGFVGVDVFFVISGFLITRLVVEQTRARTFRFSDFYIRRIRRLFPALLSTLIGCWIFAFLLFSPSEMARFAEVSAAATVSLSNFYFWREADYFDALAITKPLLHTWSLSVEEQFYLVWPLAIVVILTRWGERLLLLLLAAACATSLLIAEVLLTIDRAAAFYLLPTRVIELGLGAALVWLRPLVADRRFGLDLAALVGFGLIASAMLVLDEHSPFPGVNALWPSIGSGLIILTRGGRILGPILQLGPVVWLGRISYSLYLVHWPVIVFNSAYQYAAADEAGRWVMISLALVLATAQYALVEQRFRRIRKHSFATTPTAKLAASAAVLIVSSSLITSTVGGWPQRLPDHRLSLTAVERRNLFERRYCAQPRPKLDPMLVTCQNDRGGAIGHGDIYIFGDSHARHLVPGITEAFPQHNVFAIYSVGCVPQSGLKAYVRRFKTEAATQSCIEHNRRALEFLLAHKPTNIVISNAKRSDPAKMAVVTHQLVHRLRAKGHTVVVLADLIRPGKPLINCLSVPGFLFDDEDLQERCVGDLATARQELAYNERLAAHLPELVRADRVQCTGDQCKFFNNGRVLFRDHHHLSIEGAIEFLTPLKDQLPFSEP